MSGVVDGDGLAPIDFDMTKEQKLNEVSDTQRKT